MTGVKHFEVKTRIKDIIEADTTIFNKQGRDGKVKEVFIGWPQDKNLESSKHQKPYIFISNSSRWEEQQQRGPTTNNVMGSTLHTVRYELFVIDKGVSSADVEERVDKLHEKLVITLKKNATLIKPKAATPPDPKCEKFELVRTERLNERIGEKIDGFKITMELIIITT